MKTTALQRLARRPTRLLTASLTCAVALFSQHGLAQTIPLTNPLTVTVRVESKLEPKKAIGLVLSSNNSIEVKDTTIEKTGEKLYTISFVVDRNIVRRDSVATAMTFDENGEVTFANVSPELLSETKTLLAKIPECPGDGAAVAIQPDKVGPLQQLVEVRAERIALARLKIGRMLDDSLQQKIKKFEDAFGLEKNPDLSADLPPEALVDRLSRLSQAVKKYRTFKKPRREDADAGSPQQE